MNLLELKKRIKNWETYYKLKGIPLKKVEVGFTMRQPYGDDLVEISSKNISHDSYEPRREDEEFASGYKGKIYFISLNQFNADNGMDK